MLQFRRDTPLPPHTLLGPPMTLTHYYQQLLYFFSLIHLSPHSTNISLPGTQQILDLRDDFCSVPTLGSSRSLQSQGIVVTNLTLGLFSVFQVLAWTKPGDLGSRLGSPGYAKFLHELSGVALPCGGKVLTTEENVFIFSLVEVQHGMSEHQRGRTIFYSSLLSQLWHKAKHVVGALKKNKM